ncbi:MAG: monovalent cation/H+ antiporter complex subunit F [Acholeplasmataceae bacterium]
MVQNVLILAIVLITLMTFVGLYRAYVGPSAADRIVAINMISTKVTTIIVMIALVTEQGSYVNVALVYALIGFIATIGLAKYLSKGKLD